MCAQARHLKAFRHKSATQHTHAHLTHPSLPIHSTQVPVKAPKTYYAERCDQSCNYIIITERLKYATSEQHPRGVKANLPPYQLQRAFSKFHDHYLATDPSEYYHVLVRKQGALAGWYKSDPLRAAELNTVFPTVYGAGGAFSGGEEGSRAASYWR